MLNQIVLIVHLCTFTPDFPNLTGCRPLIIPSRSPEECETRRLSWEPDNTSIPHYFNQKHTDGLKGGTEVIVAKPHCEVLPVKTKPLYKEDGGDL